MSFKGLTKSVVRAPQNFKQKFNMGEITKDPVYIDAERRFTELEEESKRLHDYSKRYFDAINGMMNHQIGFSRAIAEIYKPISGRMSDPDSFQSEGNEAGIQACDEYERVVRELQETLAPELEMIAQRVIAPADELIQIIKAVQKTTEKRDRKQLDYDRRRATLSKLQEKKDKTLKDEKAMFKAESDVEQATQDFEYFNNLLKEELPQLFRLEREFIRPLFQSFYYMQLNVFYTLHEKMQALDIGYFDLSLDIEAAFMKKRGDVQEQTEQLTITRFKTTGGRPSGGGSRYAAGGTSKYATEKSAAASSSGLRTHRSAEGLDNPPPPYSAKDADDSAEGSSMLSPGVASRVNRANSTGKNWGPAAAKKGPAPPPPKPKPSHLARSSAQPTATALYDYDAQAEGDLSFKTGDVIEVTRQGATENEWWTGTLRGQSGQFPGNYVQLN